VDVQGRLKEKIEYWREVFHAPAPIIDCIENGYCLPLKFIPPPRCQTNHQSANLHKKIVDDAVTELLNNRCIAKQLYLCGKCIRKIAFSAELLST